MIDAPFPKHHPSSFNIIITKPNQKPISLGIASRVDCVGLKKIAQKQNIQIEVFPDVKYNGLKEYRQAAKYAQEWFKKPIIESMQIIKLPKNKVLQIIQEEIDLFVKQQINEEKYGKLIDEFATVFTEALETNDPLLKRNVKSYLTLLTEEWGDTGFNANVQKNNLQVETPPEDDQESHRMKQEIMFYLGGLDRGQLEQILSLAKNMKRQFAQKPPSGPSGPIQNPFGGQ